MENKSKMEIKKPTGRFAELDKKGFAVANIKFSSNTHDRSIEQICKTIWALKPDGTELVIGAVNEFTDAPPFITEIAKNNEESFFHVKTEKDLHSTLSKWKAESHVITFFKKNEFPKVFSIITDFGKSNSSAFGFEGDYILGFGPERLTVFIPDSHDAFEVWGSKSNLEATVNRI